MGVTLALVILFAVSAHTHAESITRNDPHPNGLTPQQMMQSLQQHGFLLEDTKQILTLIEEQKTSLDQLSWQVQSGQMVKGLEQIMNSVMMNNMNTLMVLLSFYFVKADPQLSYSYHQQLLKLLTA